MMLAVTPEGERDFHVDGAEQRAKCSFDGLAPQLTSPARLTRTLDYFLGKNTLNGLLATYRL